MKAPPPASVEAEDRSRSSTVRRRLYAMYVTTLLAAIAVVQARAQLMQVMSGFRPFAHAPIRVPYSWDMFAIRLDRCVVGWDPPLEIEGTKVARWHDREPAIEFDTVYNEASWYRAAALRGCTYRASSVTTTSLMCFGSDGGAHEFHFVCP